MLDIPFGMSDTQQKSAAVKHFIFSSLDAGCWWRLACQKVYSKRFARLSIINDGVHVRLLY